MFCWKKSNIIYTNFEKYTANVHERLEIFKITTFFFEFPNGNGKTNSVLFNIDPSHIARCTTCIQLQLTATIKGTRYTTRIQLQQRLWVHTCLSCSILFCLSMSAFLSALSTKYKHICCLDFSTYKCIHAANYSIYITNSEFKLTNFSSQLQYTHTVYWVLPAFFS